MRLRIYSVIVIALAIILAIAISPRAEQIEEVTTIETTQETTTETITEAETQKAIQMIATAYCSCEKCCGKSNGITASGKKAKTNHTIAADKSYPFGTVMVINGIEYVVEDRGGAVKGNKIDIYFESHQEALEFGRQIVEVVVL